MIKICYIIGQLSRHGAEKQLYELGKGIDRDSFSPTVISLSQGGYWAGEIRKLNIPVIELRWNKNREFSRLVRLTRLLQEIRPDIVHTSMFSANTYGRVAALLTGVPIIIASERNLPEVGKDKTRRQVYIDRLLFFFSHGIICNSHRASETLITQHSYARERVFTVQNGMRGTAFSVRAPERLRENPDEVVIGTVGRLAPQKNYRLFLDTAKVVISKCGGRGVKFLVVGGGGLRQELENHAASIGVGSNVMFTGEREDVPELLSSMDVFVMTSRYEGMSNSIMEAMASGLPVVALDVGGNSELVVDGETGFICRSHDAYALASKIVELIDERGRARRMGEKGRERILLEFSVEKMIQATEQIYVKLTDKLLN